VLAFAIGCALVGILGELALRWLLFGEGQAARELGKPLRVPSYWARSPDEDDYWKMLRLFSPGDEAGPHGPDPTMGWIREFVPGTFEHPDEGAALRRRPVLLFGDSFSQCTTSADDCWQGLLERSDLATDVALLNYGVGGYGLDQMTLLCERVIPRFASRDPIVVLAVLVDDDLERCSLSFRGHPKPRFRLEAGALALQTPGDGGTTAWLERNPPSIPSYVIRLLENVSGPRDGFEPGWTDESTLAERKELQRALLDRVRNVPYERFQPSNRQDGALRAPRDAQQGSRRTPGWAGDRRIMRLEVLSPGSCRLVDVDPYVYLRDVLVRVATHPASRVDELTPDRWKMLFGPQSAA